MSRARLILCGLLAVCAAAPAVAQARCSPPTGKVLARTGAVVVYTHKIRVQDGRQTDAFACRIVTGATKAFINPSFLLAQYDVEVPRGTIAIGGLFAAAVVNIATGSRGGPEIVVLDLHPAHPKLFFDGGPSNDGVAIVSSLVLSAGGKVAWIADLSSGPRHKHFEVVEGVGKSRLRVLDKSRKISPHSLRLSGSTLFWSDSGETRTSSL